MTALIDTLIFAGGAIAILALAMAADELWRRWRERRRQDRESATRRRALQTHLHFASPRRRLR